MFNTCMPGPTSSLEVLRLHIGGTRGPDAVQAVAGLDLADSPASAGLSLMAAMNPRDVGKNTAGRRHRPRVMATEIFTGRFPQGGPLPSGPRAGLGQPP
jgi:hypothetical protein